MKKLRSHYSTEVKDTDYEKNISLAGWVEDIRNIGSIAFIIVRDRMGTFQITALKKMNP